MNTFDFCLMIGSLISLHTKEKEQTNCLPTYVRTYVSALLTADLILKTADKRRNGIPVCKPTQFS